MRSNWLAMCVSDLLILSVFFMCICAHASTVTEVEYPSATSGGNRKLLVYLPDGYNGTTYFPTFYLLHGGGQDHNAWVREGDAKGILDRAISSGRAKPMIVVMPGVTDMSPNVFTKEISNDIIPYIEKNYKAISEKDARALAGLSWGGLQVLDAGLYRYDLFGYLGVFSSGWFIGDNIYNVMKEYLSENGAIIEKSMRYFYFSEGGTSDIAYNNGMETLKLLREGGLSVNYFEHSGSHSFVAWKQDLNEILPFLFTDAITALQKVLPDNDGVMVVNPFSEKTEIMLPCNYRYYIYSVSGQQLETGDHNSSNVGSMLSSGNYVLNIHAENTFHKIKITKQ